MATKGNALSDACVTESPKILKKDDAFNEMYMYV